MKIWVSRDISSNYVQLWRAEPEWDDEIGHWCNRSKELMYRDDQSLFGEITGIFVREGELLQIGVDVFVQVRKSGKHE